MIVEAGLGFIAGKKIAELNNLREIKKQNPNYRIIDVGGGKEKHVSDKFDFIDATVDMRNVEHNGVQHFQGNINDPFLWEKIDAEVNVSGPYDYCICTHTLEDIANPAYVAAKISSISNAGIVTFPSKYRECMRFELNGTIRGYSHHRWIMTLKENGILAFPKVNLIEDPFFDSLAQKCRKHIEEVFIIWKDKIDFNVINNDWLGPNPEACQEMYRRELSQTLEDAILQQ